MCKFPELLHSMSPSIGIQVCGSLKRKCFHSPDLHTESEQCLSGSATNMVAMFKKAEAFNQPLLSFDTSKVTSVCESTLVWRSDSNKKPDSDSHFPPHLSLDVLHVPTRGSLQSATIFRYYWGYNCESVHVWSPTAMRFQIRISSFPQLIIRCSQCLKV